MKFTARSAALYSATVAGLLMLSACGKNDQQAANAPAASSTAAPAPSATAAKPATSGTAAAPAAASTAPAAASTAAAAPAAAPAAMTAAATPAATPTADAGAFRVSTVTLGDTVTPDHKVRKDTASFTPSAKTIYVSVDTDGSTAGSTLSAKWSFLEGKGQLVTSTSQSIVAEGPATTTFKVQNPNLWPEGKYKVDISVDGKQVASKPFEVAKR